MADLSVITSITQLTKWVSSITYPKKLDRTLYICLHPQDQKKAIIQEHYKAPTLNKISHWLNSTMTFSKLDAKDSFWNVHFNEKSSYLTTLNTNKGRYWFLPMPFGLKMPRISFRCAWTRLLTAYQGSSLSMMISVSSAEFPRSTTGNWSSWSRPLQRMGSCLRAASVRSGSKKSSFVVRYSPPEVWSLILPKSKSSKTFPPQ